MGGRHVVPPSKIGSSAHDCGPASLYWAAPRLTEDRIVEAFGFCTDNWPYAGVTNREFAIVLKYLGVNTVYDAQNVTLGELLDRKPNRCVALLPHHFIPIVRGIVAGSDATHAWSPSTTVFCHWIFR